ncbi:hypothetical protein FLA_3432 [Filimonas lacunae]|nr:hypothetical protein FLA_3432 [Filimonas lacunae]
MWFGDRLYCTDPMVVAVPEGGIGTEEHVYSFFSENINEAGIE